MVSRMSYFLKNGHKIIKILTVFVVGYSLDVEIYHYDLIKMNNIRKMR